MTIESKLDTLNKKIDELNINLARLVDINAQIAGVHIDPVEVHATDSKKARVEAAPAEEENPNTITFKELQNKTLQLNKLGGMDAVSEILSDFGAPKVSALTESSYSDYSARLDKAIDKLQAEG